MDRSEVITKIRGFITENFFFGIDSIEYLDDDSLMMKGIVDSTGILELVTFVEGEFGISIEDDELIPENMDSLSNLSAFIEKKSV